MPPESEIALLTNPTSGKGKGARVAGQTIAALRSRGYVVRNLQGRDADEALDLARQCVADGLSTLVVCGGDGLIHQAVQALANSATALGIVPAGTGNDVARYFGIDRGSPAQALAQFLAGSQQQVDLAHCTWPGGERWYLTVLAAGFDAIVNERANAMRWPRGQMRYNLATLAQLRSFQPLSYTLDIDGTSLQTEAMLVAVANGASFGGGLKIAPDADLRDGLLDLVIIGPMSKGRLVTTYPRLFRGSHTGLAEYQHHRARRITVHTDRVRAYADGEPVAPLPITVQAAPGALRVIA